MAEDNLTGYVNAFARQHVGVLGDMMLDRYVWGTATRISQEAPVPVVQVRRDSSVPGGAANVVRNVISLGAQASVFGVIGADKDGSELREKLDESGAVMDGLVVCPGRPTTVKTRVLAGNQQVVRIDRETTEGIGVPQRRALRSRVAECIESGRFNALILEDYAKGVFQKDFMQAVVNHAVSHGVKVMLDPHPNNAFNVKGLTLMTPNRSEAFALAGVKYVPGSGEPGEDRALTKVASILRRRWNPTYLLVTLGAQGMALFSDDAPTPVHIPTRARQVFDVSGAGDTVMATIVLSLLAGASPLDAAKIANHAAGIVVGMVGTAAIETEALKQAIAGNR